MNNLTSEQQQAVDAFLFESRLKVNAFAGTGKTTTLLAMANQTMERGVYLAFNRAIANEVKEKSTNKRLDARTTHSLAFSSFRNSAYSSEKLTTNLQGNRIAHDLEFNDISLDGRITLTARALGYIVSAAVSRFCQSSDSIPQSKHVNLFGKLGVLSEAHQREFRSYVVKLVEYVWGKMIDPSDDAPLGHDGYLKLWALGSPRIPFEFILLDESQDTNDAVLSALLAQQSKLVLVGDKHQQIYEWRGAINAMAKITGIAETNLTQTFRFGEDIARCANRILRSLGEKLPLRGNSSIASTVSRHGNASAYLSRTNAGALESILRLHRTKHSLHVLGGTTEIRMLLEDVVRLKKNHPAVTNDLFGFESWKDVCQFSEMDEGESLRAFVKLVETYGETVLLNEIARCVEIPNQSTKIVSTAHKAKGREWDSVELNSDFFVELKQDEETRLLYVSVTRAKGELILPEELFDLIIQDESPGRSTNGHRARDCQKPHTDRGSTGAPPAPLNFSKKINP